MTSSRRRVSSDALAVLVLLLLPLVLFWPAAIRHGAFFVGDVTRLFYPLQSVYAAGLRSGQIPLWTPDALAGYPILAQGEAGMLYPPNLLLYRLLPTDLALTYSILLSFALAGLAMYAWTRALRLRPAAALFAAVTFAAGGFVIVRANHVSMITAIPWLPAVLATLEMALRRLRSGRPPVGGGEEPSRRAGEGWQPWVILGGLAFGLQCLAGHPQILLMTGLTVVAYAAFRGWPGGFRQRTSWSTWLAGIAAAVAMLVLGGMLAAVQLLPTWELTGLSQRAGGLADSFFTSFSWHPGLLVTLLYPFPFGNPYPQISIEWVAYLGILPLILAGLAVWRRLVGRNPNAPVVWFCASLAVVALLLAFGAYNPAYPLVSRVPLLNLFRAPARFWYLVTFALATLAGIGLEDLVRSRDSGSENLNARGIFHRSLRSGVWLLAPAFFVLSVVLVNLAPDADVLAGAWRFLPGVWLLASLGLLWAARRGLLTGRALAIACLALVAADLYAHGAVYGRTYNAVMDLPTFYARPAALDFLPAGGETYRVYTSEQIVPDLSVQRESFYPNTGLVHGVPAAGGYFPLVPRRQLGFLTGLTAGRLNLLNVRYVVIPQLLAVDEASELYDVENPFAPSLVGASLAVSPTQALTVEVTSYTSHSAGWPQGSPVADIVLTATDGTTVTLPLRAGIETAEWAYDREDVSEDIAHRRAPVARTWPASSGFPPRPHPGHSFLARFTLDRPIAVAGVAIRPYRPEAFVRVEDIVLVGLDGGDRSLDRLSGRPDHRLVYRSEDAAIYENHDALPRAFLVGRARRVEDGEALRLIDAPAFDPRREVLLADGEPLDGTAGAAGRAEITQYEPQRVSVAVDADTDAYLVLLDADYPGWRATVDGRPAPIYRANTMFRAVRVPAGQHRVELVYTPDSVRLGALVSLATILVVVVASVILFGLRKSRRSVR